MSVPAIQILKTSRETALSLLPNKYTSFVANMDASILEMPELQLETKFKRTNNDFALRKRLWELVEAGTDIDEVKWSRGICSSQYISQKLFLNPHRVAWLLTPLSTFSETYEAAFHLGLNKVMRFVEENEVTSDNFSDYLAFLRDFSARVIGPVARNINLRTQTVPPPRVVEPSGPVNLDQQLEDLEKKKALITIRDVNEPE